MRVNFQVGLGCYRVTGSGWVDSMEASSSGLVDFVKFGGFVGDANNGGEADAAEGGPVVVG